jgi:hypothetical protein
VRFRCLDLPPYLRNKLRFTLPLMVVPGPKEPKSMDPYLEAILEEAREYGPTGTAWPQAPAAPAPCTDCERYPVHVPQLPLLFQRMVVIVGVWSCAPCIAASNNTTTVS